MDGTARGVAMVAVGLDGSSSDNYNDTGISPREIKIMQLAFI